MRVQFLASLFFAAAALAHGTENTDHADHTSNTELVRRSRVNGPCTGKGGVAGVCVPTKSCTKDGGSYISNACPGTPDDVKCCTKPKCQRAAQAGDCRWADKCGAGKTTLSGLCPGPDSFKCCVTGTVKPPTTPKPKPTTNLGEKILAKAKQAKGLPCEYSFLLDFMTVV